MKNLMLVAYLDIKESLRSKWFYVYTIIFGGLMALFFITGVSDSVVMGFSGLSRMLLIFIQVTIVILPIFILITTVKSISGDRESNVLEYMLSSPISLKAYYWGKMLGRFFTVFLPVLFAMLLGIVFGLVNGGSLPWDMLILYTLLVFSMSFLFLGLSFFISTVVKSTDIALGLSFMVWIVLLAFIDIVLIGLMLQGRVDDSIIVTIAMLNPIEVFRIGAITLFDPELTVIGPVAYYLLDTFGSNLLVVYSVVYPIVLGLVFALLGYISFKRKDLL
jgi:ABC-2 type transport system permease protein